MLRSTSFLSFAIVLSAAVGCSSSTTDNPQTPTDTGTSVTDSGKADAVAETAPITCAADLPASYMCPDFAPAAPSTACSEAALEDFVAKCIKADFSVPTDCATWKAANAGCNTCVEDWSFDKGKVYPDDYQCYEKISPGCGKPLQCQFDCADTVCGDCDQMTSEYDDCVTEATKSGGRCYAIAAMKADSCLSDTKNAPCDVSQYYTSSPDETKLRDEVLHLLRGACRDNGDWSKADMAGDAGPSDSGTGDSGASDASDAGSATDGGAADAASGG